MRSAILLLLLVLPSESQTVTLYVGAPIKDGFVDTNRQIQDSIEDIQGRLKKVKDLALVSDPAKADVVLTVTSRGVNKEASGEHVTYPKACSEEETSEVITRPLFDHTFWVSTVLRAGAFEKEITGGVTQESGESNGAWSSSADQIANDVKAWISANADRLRTSRRF